MRDSFEGSNKNGAGGGIDALRLGDLLLWCEEGPFAFLAAVIRGNPPESLHAVLRETLTNIHEQFRSPLEEFQGDSSSLGDLVTPLQQDLQQQERPRETRLSPWLWILPLVLLLLAGGWVIRRTIVRLSGRAYVERLRRSRHRGRPPNCATENGKFPVCVIPWPSIPPRCCRSPVWIPNVSPVTGSRTGAEPAIVLRRLAAVRSRPPSLCH